MSHEEIWDDSALLRSWDDAVKEYEVSRSISSAVSDRPGRSKLARAI